MNPPISLPCDRSSAHRAVLISTTCGLLSAIGYSIANVFLRAVAHCDPIWVSAMKAAPNVLLVGPWLLLLYLRGHRFLPEPHVLKRLVLGALVAQVFGNVLFQWSLGVVGLAMAVPLCLGTIILGGAMLGVVIRYGVTGRATLSVTVFIVGVVGVISLGSLSLWQIGWQGILATRSDDLTVMLLAGLMNTAAFLALTRAFQLATVVYVNALNATQVGMAAVAGVLLFQEALSRELTLGILLTIAGLLLMKR